MSSPAAVLPIPPPATGPEAPARRLPTEVEFALRMAQALQEHGAPAHRLEELISALCRRLGLDAQVFSTPTSLFASFPGRAGADTRLVRIKGSTVDLGRLADLDAVTTGVLDGTVTPEEGLARLDTILAAPRYPGWLTVLAYGVNSGAAARIFGGGLREMGAALAIGLVTGVLAEFVAGRGRGPKAFEPMAAAVSGLLAAAISWALLPLSVPTATLAGLIALVPGYTLTVALIEVTTGHLASGSARLVSALLLFFTIGFGVAMGGQVAGYLPGGVPSLDPVALPGWTEAAAIAVACATFAVIFRARPADTPWIVLTGFLAVGGARLGTAFLTPELGTFLGAFAVGVASNLFARIARRPAAIPLVPSLMLLVPGRLALRSLEQMGAHDVVSGVQTAFSMALVAVALAAGLLFSHEVVSPRRAL
jgi:uncharacterized membrane protein YjjP (DUF1212 family)